MQAIWNDAVVAESDQTIVVEGNHYFPTESVREEYLVPSQTWSICYWKGRASYFDLTVHGRTNPGAAWQYRHPLPPAHRVKDRVAFWRGVRVVPAGEEGAAAS